MADRDLGEVSLAARASMLSAEPSRELPPRRNVGRPRTPRTIAELTHRIFAEVERSGMEAQRRPRGR